MSIATTIPEPIPDRSDVTKALRTSYMLRAAHMGIMLDKMQRQIRRAEGYELMAATGSDKYLKSAVEDNEMAVSIGNEYHYHYQGATPAEPQQPAAPTVPETEATASEEEAGEEEEEPEPETEKPTGPPPAPPTQQTTTNGNGLKKYIVPTLVGAGLIAGGMGLGLLLSECPKPAPIVVPGSRLETIYGIHVYD